jgi:hypothetical protein
VLLLWLSIKPVLLPLLLPLLVTMLLMQAGLLAAACAAGFAVLLLLLLLLAAAVLRWPTTDTAPGGVCCVTLTQLSIRTTNGQPEQQHQRQKVNMRTTNNNMPSRNKSKQTQLQEGCCTFSVVNQFWQLQE